MQVPGAVLPLVFPKSGTEPWVGGGSGEAHRILESLSL
jgi:hypothetical protein